MKYAIVIVRLYNLALEASGVMKEMLFSFGALSTEAKIVIDESRGRMRLKEVKYKGFRRIFAITESLSYPEGLGGHRTYGVVDFSIWFEYDQ